MPEDITGGQKKARETRAFLNTDRGPLEQPPIRRNRLIGDKLFAFKRNLEQVLISMSGTCSRA